MQIPQCIAKDVVPKMTSLPAAIKPKISTVGSGEISYHDQVIMITFTDDGKTPASATYYIPSWEDILAEDWSCITPADETGTPDNRPVTERIKTFEDACDDLNRRAQAGDKLANDLMTDLQFNSPRTPDLLAYIQLRIITYALNEGWVPQFTEDEYRYYPYFYLYTQKEIDEMSEDDKAQLLLVGGLAVRYAVFRLRPRLAVSRARARARRRSPGLQIERTREIRWSPIRCAMVGPGLQTNS